MRYLITFSYDGSKYNGYQIQPNCNTIQNEIEQSLKQIFKKDIRIHSSGRTDALVHALNQKAHFDVITNMSCTNIKNALNSLLSKNIYIKNVINVKSDFHARYSVKYKEYIYKINIGEYNPLECNYIYQYNKNLDIKKMKKAIKNLKGTHNFKSFTASDDCKNNYIRTIYKAKISRKNNIIIIYFKGNGFMRYMVRNMVGTLIEIGENKRNYKDIKAILKYEDRSRAGKTANAEGLYLKDVIY